MAVNIEKYTEIKKELGHQVTLVAVSKMKTEEEIRLMYSLGQRDFGENYVQELVAKQLVLPNDIRWHFIGHLQSNKVKYIAPYVHKIHSVDSFKLLEEIDRQALRNNRVISCLLQIHIAQEESKFGFNDQELRDLIESLPKYKILNKLNNVKLCGVMGMASFTENPDQIRKEFKYLKCLFDDAKAELNLASFKTLSMGMSNDYRIAVEEGSNMVRVGSLLFGNRNNFEL